MRFAIAIAVTLYATAMVQIAGDLHKVDAARVTAVRFMDDHHPGAAALLSAGAS